MGARRPAIGGLDHVELWVPDLAGAAAGWDWLLTELGWEPFQHWASGRSWRWSSPESAPASARQRLGETYLVIEESPALSARVHDRHAPGLNHLSFHAGPASAVDRLVELAPGHGWSLLFPDRHPYAGGPDHYAAYLEDRFGYEVELVASTDS